MLKVLFYAMNLAGQILSSPIYIVHDALNLDRESIREPSKKPFSCEAQYLWVEDTTFENLPDQTLGYQQIDTSLVCALPLTQQSGLLLSTGFISADIQWKSNEVLNQDAPHAVGVWAFQDKSRYNYALLSLGAYTLSLKNWQWSLIFSVLLDPEKLQASYGLYQAVLSGKFHASDELSVVFGMINEAGLYQEKAWPLLGLSYRPTRKLTFNCIYPVNFSIEYQSTPVCDFSLEYKITRFRKRLHANAYSFSEGIVEYHGRELVGNIKMIPYPNSSIKFFIGRSIGNDISIADSRNKNRTSHPFHSSSCIGGSALLSF